MAFFGSPFYALGIGHCDDCAAMDYFCIYKVYFCLVLPLCRPRGNCIHLDVQFSKRLFNA